MCVQTFGSGGFCLSAGGDGAFFAGTAAGFLEATVSLRFAPLKDARFLGAFFAGFSVSHLAALIEHLSARSFAVLQKKVFI